MDDSKVDVAVVGGGLAGAAAADVLGRHGARVLVLDDNLRPGGQYLRGGRGSGGGWADVVRRRGLKMIDRLPRATVAVKNRVEVLGIEPGFELLAADGNGGIFTVEAKHVLLATGVRERFVPFNGWTLPGVLAAGAVQVLIKQSGVLPARNTLVAGAGLFLTTVAGDILKSGGRVTAVLDEAPLRRRIPPLFPLAGQFLKFAQGGMLLARLLSAGTRVRHNTRIIEVRGAGRVLEVTAARVDHRGAVVSGSEAVFPVSCLSVGFGFTANTELAQLAGCRMSFDAALGGWVVQVDEGFETSVAGIYAAGEITAIGGGAKSLIEGRLAGLSILRRMDGRRPGSPVPEAAALLRARRRQLNFARYFNAQHTFGPDRMQRWISGLSDDLVICRCEGVRLGEVRRAVAAGFDAPAGLKKATRCGMGVCQGSTCKMVLLEVLAALTGQPCARIPLPSVRMPIKPVTLGELAGGGL